MHSLKVFTFWQERVEQLDTICDVVSNEVLAIRHLKSAQEAPLAPWEGDARGTRGPDSISPQQTKVS